MSLRPVSLRPSAIAAVCSAIGLAGQPAPAQPVESFYRGKTVTMVIGYPPAGANDVYARMVARHIGKHIPGNPAVVPRNMPGAGSLIAANHIFNVAPQGRHRARTAGADTAAGGSARRYRR